ncbi:MAG: hypothetical protein ACYCVB_16475 [Bacilli bacterium]
MYERLKRQFMSTEPPRSIVPLLWYHGEDDSLILEEIRRMDEMGCAGFIIESRPHPDYLGQKWWHDVRISVEEARERNMEVWIFDEESFPSGFAGGRVLAKNPDFRYRVLVKRHLDIESSDGHLHVPLDQLIHSGDNVISLVAIPLEGDGKPDPERAVFVTDGVG